eukprot:gene12793-15122_t
MGDVGGGDGGCSINQEELLSTGDPGQSVELLLGCLVRLRTSESQQYRLLQNLKPEATGMQESASSERARVAISREPSPSKADRLEQQLADYRGRLAQTAKREEEMQQELEEVTRALRSELAAAREHQRAAEEVAETEIVASHTEKVKREAADAKLAGKLQAVMAAATQQSEILTEHLVDKESMEAQLREVRELRAQESAGYAVVEQALEAEVMLREQLQGELQGVREQQGRVWEEALAARAEAERQRDVATERMAEREAEVAQLRAAQGQQQGGAGDVARETPVEEAGGQLAAGTGVAEREAVEAEREELRSELQAAQEQQGRALAEWSALQAEVAAARAEQALALGRGGELEAVLDETRGKNAALEAERADLEQALQAAAAELQAERKQSEAAALEQEALEEQLKKDAAALRPILQALEDERAGREAAEKSLRAEEELKDWVQSVLEETRKLETVIAAQEHLNHEAPKTPDEAAKEASHTNPLPARGWVRSSHRSGQAAPGTAAGYQAVILVGK